MLVSNFLENVLIINLFMIYLIEYQDEKQKKYKETSKSKSANEECKIISYLIKE